MTQTPTLQCNACGARGPMPIIRPAVKALHRWTVLGTLPLVSLILLPVAFAAAVNESTWAFILGVAVLLEHLAWVLFVAGRAAPRGDKVVRTHVGIVLGVGFLTRSLGVALGLLLTVNAAG